RDWADRFVPKPEQGPAPMRIEVEGDSACDRTSHVECPAKDQALARFEPGHHGPEYPCVVAIKSLVEMAAKHRLEDDTVRCTSIAQMPPRVRFDERREDLIRRRGDRHFLLDPYRFHARSSPFSGLRLPLEIQE